MQREQSSGTTQTKPMRGDAIPTLLIALWVVLVPILTHSILAARGPVDAADVAAAVDPNLAPWWELTVLPRIGPTTSRAIVAHRLSHDARQPPNARRAFAVPEDLMVIRGIGPVTVRRIARELTFGETASVTPSGR